MVQAGDFMLVLNREDMQKCMSLEECVEAMEKAYKIFNSERYTMPNRPCIENGENTLLYMPCFTDECFGTKCLTLFPKNPSRNKPMIDGMMILNDGDDGSIKALMHAGFLTALRTGANTGVMLKNLAPKTAQTCGIVGAGVQGVFQTAFACRIMGIKTVYVYDRKQKGIDEFKRKTENLLGEQLEFIQCTTVEKLVEKSDIIIAATTSNTPVFPDDEDIFKNKTVVAIGSYKPHCRECPDALVKSADNIYVDLAFAKEESGDLFIPIKEEIISENKIHQISDVLYSPDYKNHIIGKTIFIKTVGMALFDVVCAQEIYNKAIAENIGTHIDF